MNRQSALRAGTAALHLLSLAGAAVPLAMPAPAGAQAPAPSDAAGDVQQQPVDWQGVWAASLETRDQPIGYIDLKSRAGVLGGTQWVVDSAGPRDIGRLIIDPTRSTSSKLLGSVLYDDSIPGTVELSIAPDGSYASMITTLGSRTGGVYLRRVANLGSVPAVTTGAALRSAMIGTWATNLGTLRITEQAKALVGTITRQGDTSALFSFTATRMPSSGEFQDWTMARPQGGDGSFRIVLAPDGKSFLAFAPSNKTRLFGDLTFLEARKTGATVPSPNITQAPKPGYTACHDWCAVKIVNSTVVNMPVDGGKLSPMTVLDVAVHNQSAEYRTIQPIFIGWETIGFLGSAGTFDHSKPAVTSNGPMNMTTGAGVGRWPYVMEPIGLAPGAEVRVTHVLGGGQIPQNLDRLLVVYQGEKGTGAKRTEVIGGQRLLCDHYAAEQKLKAAGTLAFAVGPLPAQCRTSQEPAPPAPAPVPPVAQPPAPPPVVVRPPAPLPGTVQAGVFHSLGRFDVRLDDLRASRDGKVHLFVTVANKSGAARSIGQSTLAMVMTDADGVGIYTGTPYRADGEDLEAYNIPPILAAGGEIRLRYVMEPPVVHGPISRIGIRESDARILYFDAAQADDGSNGTLPPPSGSGDFKPLSKLDVRIDRAGAARDGRFEAFLTFRNPTRQPQSVNAAEQRLSGTNSDGSPVTARYALYSVRGERGENDALPVPVYVEAGGQIRVRYVFDNAPRGTLRITDGTATQAFTPGG